MIVYIHILQLKIAGFLQTFGTSGGAGSFPATKLHQKQSHWSGTMWISLFSITTAAAIGLSVLAVMIQGGREPARH